MKILFNRNNSIGTLCLLLLLAAVAGACVKDEYAEKEKATLTLYFTTTKNENGTSSDGTIIGQKLPNEHMRTLRVIVADKQGKIRYNTKVNVPENQTQTVINFSELIVDSDGTTTFDVYAIANEEVLKILKNKILDNTILSKLNEGIAKDEYKEGYAVPQTAIQEVTVTPGQDNSATIPLEFVVAKVRMTINNTSAVKQTVSEIKLSGLNIASTPLFAGDPLSTEKTGELSLGGMTISAGGVATVYAYFYENQNTDGYQLTANWNGKGQKLLLQTDSDGYKQTITKIPRGKMLDITIKLNADVDIEPTINVQVDEWTGKTIDVPPFQ